MCDGRRARPVRRGDFPLSADSKQNSRKSNNRSFMIRLLLLLVIVGLAYLGARTLLASLRGDGRAGPPPPQVEDLRACSRCGTFVEAELLDQQLVCPDCRDRQRQ